MENNNRFKVVKQNKSLEHTIALAHVLYVNDKRKLENSIDSGLEIDLTDSEAVSYATAMVENYFGKISYKEYEKYAFTLYKDFERLARLDYEMTFINNNENVKQAFIYKVLENSQDFKDNKIFNSIFEMLIKNSLMIMRCLPFDDYTDVSIIKYREAFNKICKSNLDNGKQKLIK